MSDVKIDLDSLDETRRLQMERMLADKFICGLVGIKLIEAGDGRACAELELREDHMNGLGICQGGVLFSLSDYALAAAFNYKSEPVASLNVSIEFCKAVSSGVLRAEAVETFRSRTTTLGDVVVKNEKDEVICHARGRGYIFRS